MSLAFYEQERSAIREDFLGKLRTAGTKTEVVLESFKSYHEEESFPEGYIELFIHIGILSSIVWLEEENLRKG